MREEKKKTAALVIGRNSISTVWVFLLIALKEIFFLLNVIKYLRLIYEKCRDEGKGIITFIIEIQFAYSITYFWNADGTTWGTLLRGMDMIYIINL